MKREQFLEKWGYVGGRTTFDRRTELLEDLDSCIRENQPKQKCPKCNGQGTVSKPPHVTGDYEYWTSDRTSYICNLCNGSMVIPSASEELTK